MDAIIGNGLLLQPPQVALYEVLGELGEEVDWPGQFDLLPGLQEWKAKQTHLSKFLKDYHDAYGIKLRRIIPIGRPLQAIYVGMSVICHKCQRTTVVPKNYLRNKDSTKGGKNFSLVCSNKKCGHDLYRCRNQYRNCSRIKKNDPLLEPPLEYYLYRHYEVILHVCSRCSTFIPMENPANLSHPCWESHKGSYYQKVREGGSFMVCCKCLSLCKLQRHDANEMEGKKGNVKYTLFCKEGCGHVNEHWNDCENCVRLVEEQPPANADTCEITVEQPVEHEKVEETGFWEKFTGILMENYVSGISVVLGCAIAYLV
ncbi:hypothetical protein HYFRA_00010369 [Hymenoscyphus fraxineus]|uniref:Uncharacterized protein n=1 Tax=Hymenoscyphus fraxineus TaxID=746836 RepID=A0A9N9L0S1_9HELO|nr:hypothetical protein HYFRA_00010369 [Hymenoscyphus fraxineus]